MAVADAAGAAGGDGERPAGGGPPDGGGRHRLGMAGCSAPGGAAEPAPAAGRLDELALPGAIERPWTAQRSFGRQFGIITLPEGEGDRPLGVVLLNGGAVRHTGPNRMWVEAARRWAARGVPVLRLDIEGLGDSDGDPRPYVANARLYDPDLAVQAGQAVADLVDAGVAERWLVAGLCAGASWGFTPSGLTATGSPLRC